MNLFRYTADDPLDQTDPTGLVASDTSRPLPDRMWEMACLMDSGNSFVGSIVDFFKRLLPAGMDNPRDSSSGTSTGKFEVQSAKVVITQQQIDVKSNDDGSASGWTPNPRKNSFVSTVATGANKLALTYHLRILSYINTARGPKNQEFSRSREPDHTNDFKDAKDRFRIAAESLVGRHFETRTETALALRAAVDPKVDRVFLESYGRWDARGIHYPQENGRFLNRDE